MLVPSYYHTAVGWGHRKAPEAQDINVMSRPNEAFELLDWAWLAAIVVAYRAGPAQLSEDV